MAPLKMSWDLCDGRLTAKWSENENEQPLASVIWDAVHLTNEELNRLAATSFARGNLPGRTLHKAPKKLPRTDVRVKRA